MKSKLIVLLVANLLVMQSCESDSDPSAKKLTNPLDFNDASGTIITIAGTSEFGFSGDGDLSTTAELDFVTGVSVDLEGNVYVAGGASNTIRKIFASTGIIQKYSGVFLGWNVYDPTPLHGENGPAEEAHLNFPFALHVDKNKNVIILDAGNRMIREIRGSDSTIYKIGGGNSWTDFAGDGELATTASFDNPYALASDADGNIYVADQENNVIRKITRATGIITSVAGKGPDHAGYSGDNGLATEAELNRPKSVAVDNNGNIYISDTRNHVIRKVSNGIITTIAGTGVEGYSGDGADATDAKLNVPDAITVDNESNIYFYDALNNVIRKVDTNGIITTYVGTGVYGYSGDGGPADQATIDGPWGLATDNDGNLYIADTNNAVVRVVIK